MLMDPTRPFYRLGMNIFLGPIPRDDFRRFLKDSFLESSLTVEDSAVNLILDLAEDVPFNVQMLAHQCWSDLRESSRRTGKLTSVHVRTSLTLLVRQQDPFYAQLWNSLTSIQQRTLIAVVTEKGANMQTTRVMQAIGKGSGTVRQSLLSMQAMTILREDIAANHKLYRFEDPFFAEWIRLTTASLSL